MKVDYGSGEVEVEASILSLQVYEQQFGRDMIDDVIHSDSVGDDGAVKITDWMAAPRALWACLKARDPETPSFDKWAAQTSGLNMHRLRSGISRMLADAFFRPETAAEG